MTIYKKLDNKNIAVLEILTPIPKNLKIRLISRIQVPSEFKNQGYENDLLKIACDLADKEEFTLYFQITNKKLIKTIMSWMKLHNFFLAAQPDLMCRISKNQPERPTIEQILEVQKSLESDD
jgi:hypothetical protein